MPRTLHSARHKALVDLLIERRKRAGLTQADVARKLREHQSFVARVEGGERRLDVVELLEFGEAIGFDPCEVLGLLKRVKH